MPDELILAMDEVITAKFMRPSFKQVHRRSDLVELLDVLEPV